MDGNFPYQTLKYQKRKNKTKPQTLKYLIKQPFELINQYSKIVGFKINTQKSTVLLHTCSDQSQSETEKTIHL